jgi:glycosyltransferase involved in cell wall biosynthesis
VSDQASTSNGVEVSVVMPCLNEAESLGVCIQKALSCLAQLGVRGEVVVADNGSTDGSQEIGRRSGARVVDIETKGYGSALMGGIAAARGRYVIMGDADDSYDFTALEPFLVKLREDYDLVMGNRFLGGIQPGAMPALHRYLGNPVLTRIGRILFKSPVGDFHCGLRGFRKDAIQGLNLQTTGMEFASEMVVKSTLAGLRIAEVPTTLSPSLRTRPPHLRTWTDGWRHLRFLLLYSPRWLFLYPGAFLMLVGLLVSLWLLPGPRYVGSVGFDVHTLLFASAAIIVGFQAIVFALFTKVFAISEGLLPEDPRMAKAFRYITLETGLAVGFLLVLVGLGGSIYAFLHWSVRSFGPLDTSLTLRTVIPSVTSLILGIQVVLASFFLSVLGMRRSKSTPPLADS